MPIPDYQTLMLPLLKISGDGKVHTLFDRGYLTVSPDYHVEVSHRLKEEFDNGKEYYALQGKTILLPGNPLFRPSPEQLGWHNDNVYRP
jgi:putative restriction endonuclease